MGISGQYGNACPWDATIWFVCQEKYYTGTFLLLLLFCLMVLRFHHTPACTEAVIGRFLEISDFKSFLPLNQLVFALHHESMFHVGGIMWRPIRPTTVDLYFKTGKCSAGSISSWKLLYEKSLKNSLRVVWMWPPFYRCFATLKAVFSFWDWQ